VRLLSRLRRPLVDLLAQPVSCLAAISPPVFRVELLAARRGCR